jgi:endoglucanase
VAGGVRGLAGSLAAAVVVIVLGGALPALADEGAKDNDQPLSLRVAGNQLINGVHRVVHLSGVNRSGTEYACVRGLGIFDGPSDDASARAIADWPVNAVRVPLNEDCWLGINGAPTQDSGAAYRAAVADYVRALHRTGLFAELSLAWVAPGDQLATGSQPMPDADHAPAFWRSVAAQFRDDGAVLFGAYGEPHDVSWACWRDGGSACGTGYRAAGMDSLVRAIRSTGADQPIALSGLDRGNDLGSWLRYRPGDPAHALVAEAHVYNSSPCRDLACWSKSLLPVAGRVPLVTAELGENDCRGTFVDSYLTFAGSHGISFLAWTWNTTPTCGALITSYQGTPTAYGFVYREHVSGLAILDARAANAGAQVAPAAPTGPPPVLWVTLGAMVVVLAAATGLVVAGRRTAPGKGPA